MTQHHLGASVAMLLIGLAVAASPVRAAPQTFNTALPVARGEFVFREQFVYRSMGNDPGATNREVSVRGAVSVLGYGITPELAVFGALPLLDKELKLTPPGGPRASRDTTGIGDARLFGRYTVFRDDAPGRTFRVAPFLGIELPTGDDNDRDGSGTLPPALQLGSGSWDPFGGLVASYQALDVTFDAQASYQINTEANGFRFGNLARFDASVQYRLWPRELGSGTPGFLYGVLEGNLIHQERNEIAGVADRNSGGVSAFLSPGLQYATRRWIAEAIVQVPVVQNLRGSALEDDFIVRAGFRVNF